MASAYRECRYCGERIVLVSIPGQDKRVPVDYEPGPGFIAAYQTAAGAWTGRRLGQGDQLEPHEKRHAAHECDGEKRAAQRGQWTAAVSAHAKERRRRRAGPGRRDVTGVRLTP